MNSKKRRASRRKPKRTFHKKGCLRSRVKRYSGEIGAIGDFSSLGAIGDFSSLGALDTFKNNGTLKLGSEPSATTNAFPGNAMPFGGDL